MRQVWTATRRLAKGPEPRESVRIYQTGNGVIHCCNPQILPTDVPGTGNSGER